MNGPLEIVNGLSIDVEDYFQVAAFAPYIHRSEWDSRPCRIERNIDRILELLENADTSATFFTLGWIAERYPQLVRRIVSCGHELASHGYGHQRATELSAEGFSADIRLAKSVLEDLSSTQVKGYRAPSFSIGASNPWALECIERAGYQYSSSIYPIRHDHYGVPSAPRFKFRPSASLVEVPIATVRLLSRNWPAGGGGYFRLMPYRLSHWALRRINRSDGRPIMFYLHPWELDPEQPRVPGLDVKTRFRHYVNLGRTEKRLQRLLTDFRWDRVDKVFLGADDDALPITPFQCH
jgi:polysaccharide deacetylase family protein (PEP-CTERM system associated)